MKNFVKPLAHCLVQCYRGPFKSGVDFNSYCAIGARRSKVKKSLMYSFYPFLIYSANFGIFLTY